MYDPIRMTCASSSTEGAKAVRLDRLLGITLELMAKKRVTAVELAAKFEVSVRTVYRDVELINRAGIPVASFTGADGGFYIHENEEEPVELLIPIEN
mgnify:CR=1 FL=1